LLHGALEHEQALEQVLGGEDALGLLVAEDLNRRGRAAVREGASERERVRVREGYM
jgi:hypothetical protein